MAAEVMRPAGDDEDGAWDGPRSLEPPTAPPRESCGELADVSGRDWIWMPNTVSSGGQAPGPNQNDLGTFIGRIKSFNTLNGYGFIECAELKSRGMRDAFLHHSQLQDFAVGSVVRFVAYLSNKGHPQAKDLQPHGAGAPPTPAPAGTGEAPSQPASPEAAQAALEPQVVGTFVGVLKVRAQWNGFGFVASAALRAQGFEVETFIHRSQFAGFGNGAAVRFEAYVDEKGKLKGRSLRHANADEIALGKKIVTRTKVDSAGGGYLATAQGTEVEVLYIGESPEEKDWLYVHDCVDGSEGWLPVTSVTAPEGCNNAGGGQPKAAPEQTAEPRPAPPARRGAERRQPRSSAPPPPPPPGAPPPGATQRRTGAVVPPPPPPAPQAADDARGRVPSGPPPGGQPAPQPAAGGAGPRAEEQEAESADHAPEDAEDGVDDTRISRDVFLLHRDRATPSEQASDMMERVDLMAAAASAQAAGFELLGASAHAAPSWEYPLCDLARNCFVGHLPAAVPEARASELLAGVMNGMDILGWDRPASSMGRMSRGTKWMVSDGCRCPYRYGGVSVDPTPFPQWMNDLVAEIMPLVGLPERETWPNSCNLNCYTDGTDGIDWHTDDEPLFQGRERPCAIVSLSLGEARTFELRLAEEREGAASSQLRLRGGDLCTMEGNVQRYYEHRIPKASAKNLRLRVNLTWRWITQHDRRCGL